MTEQIVEKLTGRHGDQTGPFRSLLRRFGCYFLDRMLAGGLVMAGIVLYSIFADLPLARYGNYYVRTTITLIVLVAAMTVFNARFGQSPGKMTGYLKVVKLDGNDISFVQALARALFSHGVEILPFWIYFTAKVQNPLAVGVSFLYLCINSLFVLADTKERRALHDIIAGTKVISLVRREESGETL